MAHHDNFEHCCVAEVGGLAGQAEEKIGRTVHHPLEGSEYLTEEPELNSRGKPAESEKEKDEKQNEPD